MTVAPSQNVHVQAQPPVLSVRKLGKTFPIKDGLRTKTLRALHDISFDLHPGEVISLVGESGSGKSTILRLIARLLEPTSGQILFHGEEIHQRHPHRAALDYRRRVQMIFQDPFGSLNPVHRVRHHLERPLRRHRLTRTDAETEARISSLLETVGLSPAQAFAQKRPHQMSGGQRQRVAIARALALEPEIILADEPTSMLDVSIRMGVLNLLLDLKEQRGLSYLYVTHDIASARYIADRIIVMYAGHAVEEGPSDELLASPRHPYTKLLLAAIPDPTSDPSRVLPARSGQPKLIEPGPGCPFAPRCPEAQLRCEQESPRPLRLGQGSARTAHVVRCHLVEDDAADSARTEAPAVDTK